jgi:hypothetical protein
MQAENVGLTAIERLRDAVQKLHGCDAFHWRTERVCEVRGEEIIWNRQVEVFKLKDHPKAEFCYAWAYEGDEGKAQYMAVLNIPPITSPERAVESAIGTG